MSFQLIEKIEDYKLYGDCQDMEKHTQLEEKKKKYQLWFKLFIKFLAKSKEKFTELDQIMFEDDDSDTFHHLINEVNVEEARIHYQSLNEVQYKQIISKHWDPSQYLTDQLDDYLLRSVFIMNLCQIMFSYFSEWKITKFQAPNIQNMYIKKQRILKDISHISFSQLKILDISQSLIFSIQPLSWISAPSLEILHLTQAPISLKSLRKTSFGSLFYLTHESPEQSQDVILRSLLRLSIPESGLYRLKILSLVLSLLNFMSEEELPVKILHLIINFYKQKGHFLFNFRKQSFTSLKQLEQFYQNTKQHDLERTTRYIINKNQRNQNSLYKNQ